MCKILYKGSLASLRFYIFLFSLMLLKTFLCNFLLKRFLAGSGLQIRVHIGKVFSLFLIQNICCGYSKEPSQWDGSFEHPKLMFRLMDKKIIKILGNEMSLSGPMWMLAWIILSPDHINNTAQVSYTRPDGPLVSRVRTDLKSTWIYRTVLKSPWKLNLPWKVLENTQRPWKVLTFYLF